MKFPYFELVRQENTLNYLVTEAYKEAAKQTEEMILKQLNELIKRELLVIEETHPVLVSSFHSAGFAEIEVRMERSVRLVLKDQEYIEQLEDKIQGLEQQLEQANTKLTNWENSVKEILAIKPKQE